MRYGLIIAVATVGLATTAVPATAQDDAAEDRSQEAAEVLFAQGRELMRKADHAAACAKFEASLALKPAMATRLNLARCYEAVGDLERAWGVYRQAEKSAKDAEQMGSEAFAHERAKQLEPRLTRLVIKLADGARVPGLVVKRGDDEVAEENWDQPLFINPGEYLIVATAPGHTQFSQVVTADAGGEVTVDIPAFGAATSGSAGGASATGEASARPAALTGPIDERIARSGERRRTLGVAVGAAGLVAVATGLGFGFSAKANWEDSFNQGLCNRETLICSQAGQDKTDVARSRADLAGILTGAGALVIATGVVLYLTAPKRRPATRARIVPSVNPTGDSVGVAVIGNF